MEARTLNRIATVFMPLSLGTMTIGAYVGFAAHDTFALQAQVGAHISILLGAAALTLSCILHLITGKQLEINDFARLNPSAPIPMTTPCENIVHECCLTGMHRL